MELSENAAKSIRDNLRQMDTRGYYKVEWVTDLNENADIVQKLKAIFKASGASNYHDGLQNVNDYLSFSATDINNSLFSHAQRLGSKTYGAGNSGQWSAIKHIFDVPELGTVRLNELQAGPAGHTVHVLPEQLNEQVNELPAKYTVEVAADGKALTSLVWENGNNMYEMYMQRNAGTDKEAKAYFFELAHSLPDPSND